MDALTEELLAAETDVWEAMQTGDARADRAALSDDFLGVFPDGYSGREDHVAQLATGPSIRDFTLSEARSMQVGPDHGLLSYRARYTPVVGGAEEEMYVSSLWRRDGPRWINIFSQDTPTGRAVP
ncbi:nuclear transport factor 2 family protein [Histidinibacterium aquaticum]|uniref:Nuclear transport factor 2 family protein n=1 Tax=Histidinibacterium aquaticum TaxID=2613962 RepID=A0A5J5GCK2_9RHOB|nr:nuclear transport factor 2 family protein [Histidinibacterium aquaticum]KAA9005688.1 nuclear transport factor 2 family protein [Histidinibacterium aquaticum]